MSAKKISDSSKTPYKCLSDFKLLNLYSQSGSDWSFLIEEEIQAATTSSIEAREAKFMDKVVSFGILAILALLGAATWSQAEQISQTVQDVGKNSVKQVMLEHY